MTSSQGMDPEKLLLKISSGNQLTEEELSFIVSILESYLEHGDDVDISVDDVYSSVLIIGKAQARQHKKLLEQFLHMKDPLTVALVLDILCLQWDGAADCMERVVNFALGVAWDEDDDVRQMSFNVLGESLRKTFAQFENAWSVQEKTTIIDEAYGLCEMLDLVLHAFDDEGLATWTRQSAYYALCRIAGRECEDIPPECKPLDFSETSVDIDIEVLNYCRESLSDAIAKKPCNTLKMMFPS